MTHIPNAWRVINNPTSFEDIYWPDQITAEQWAASSQFKLPEGAKITIQKILDSEWEEKIDDAWFPLYNIVVQSNVDWVVEAVKIMLYKN